MDSNQSFRAEGKVHSVGETQQVKDTFRKRDLVLEYYENPNFRQYPQHIRFEATQDRCVLLDGCNEGDEVIVEFNLRGREWTNPKGEKVYFNTLSVNSVTPLHNAGPQGMPPPADFNVEPMNQLPEDDLPF